MLSKINIQLKAQQYLQIFQQSHQKKKNILKQLEIKVNQAAKRIQRIWRKFILNKKIISAIKIQKIWRKYKKIAELKRNKINRFRIVFYSGKISNFIYCKYFQKNKNKSSTISNKNKDFDENVILKKRKVLFSDLVSKYFSPFITLQESYQSQIKYVQKLRVYQKNQFSEAWQKYEQNLKEKLYKQAQNKWVKKDNLIWISQQNKEINLEQYIQSRIQKLFKSQYQKYHQNDKKLDFSVSILQQNVKHFRRQYFKKLFE